jgi:hypothetical protein
MSSSYHSTASTGPATGTPAATRRPRGNQAGVLGPYSRIIDRGARGAISGNTWEGRYLRTYEQMLIEHVGGNPNIVQRALITRASRLALHLELMDKRSLSEGKPLTTHDHLHYVSWSNAITRLLARLGLEPTAPAVQLTAHSYAERYPDAEFFARQREATS